MALPPGHAAGPPWSVPRAVYLHIPFCRTKCLYCDFNTYAGKERLTGDYVAALVDELRQRAPEAGGQTIRTVYFGGGTPSVLTLTQVRRIIGALRRHYTVDPAAEITFEANPGTFGTAYMAALVESGITRVSLGVQSLDDETLRRLARTHNAQTAIDAVSLCRQGGVRSVNLDLIYGLPWQSTAQWRDHLQRALATEPDHISLYALTIEEGTPLATLVGRGSWQVPDADEVADLYEAALPVLERAGFTHYEVSNWGRPGHASQHNLVYWRNEAYLGCGAGAHSYVGGRRFWNVRPIEQYIGRVQSGQTLEAGDERLDENHLIAETAALALRLRNEGLDYARFQERFGIDPRQRWPAELQELAEVGVLRLGATQATLTDAGLLVSNDVAARFMP